MKEFGIQEIDNICSNLKLDKTVIQKCRKKYNVPAEFKFFQAIENVRAHHNPDREGKRDRIVIYLDQLEGGLRFPLDPFLILFFCAYNIAPAQLHLNGYRFLTAFCELIRSHGREPTVQMHRYMFSLIKKKGDLTFSLSAVANFSMLGKLPDINRS